MGSMGDCPMIKVRSDTGKNSQWTRDVNSREQDALYRSGRRIEIDYVVQRHRRRSFDPDVEHEVVIEIRIESEAEGEIPGSYEKVRVKEIAQGVLTQPFWTAPEVSHELAELGHTPGVMSDEVHKVFLDARTDIDRLLREGPKGPDERQQTEHAIVELHECWKDAVFGACRKILDEHS